MKTYNHIYDNSDGFSTFTKNIAHEKSDKLLVRIHSAIHTKDEIRTIIELIKRNLPDAYIVGCSAMQVISDGHLYADSCLISVSVVEKSDIKLGHISCMQDGKMLSGNQLAHKLIDQCPANNKGFMLLFFPLAYSKIEEFVDTANESDFSVKMLGGAAYKEDEMGNARPDLSYLVLDDGVYNDEMVYAYIYSDELSVYTDYVCGVENVGNRCTIRSNGCYIDTVDGISGAEWYSSMLGKEELEVNPSISHVFPIIKRNGRGIAYYVDYIEENDRISLKSFGELKNGSEISLGYFHPQKIFDNVSRLMKNVAQNPAEVIFAYDCQSRMNLLHNCASWEIGNFNATNISGALLSGEISCREEENLYANYTFVVASLSENKESRFILNEIDRSKISELQEDNVQMLNYLLQNANRHLSDEIVEQQNKIQNAVFYNAALKMNNQLRFQFDEDRLAYDKTAVFWLNNEKMLRLFSGITKTYDCLKNNYKHIIDKYSGAGMNFYSYEDTALMVSATDTVGEDVFIDTMKEIKQFLDEISFAEISLSYTLAVFIKSENTLQDIETALAYAKKHKLTYVRFDEIGDDLKKEQEKIQMLWVIRDALSYRRVLPYFQEIHNNKNSEKRMFESLMRVYDEDGKIYYPDSFLPVAKEFDLYDSLSELMINTVMDMFNDMDLMVTINLNVQDIYNHNIIRLIFSKLKSVAHPENFVFEIVESEEIKDYEFIKEFSNRVHEHGGKIAIDDFGSGFSNLLHIFNIEADYIKIDGEIIKSITTDNHCREFIDFINAWCERDGQELICEYVENEEIQNIMEELGVCHSQGYYFSKPQPWHKYEEMEVKEDEKI